MSEFIYTKEKPLRVCTLCSGYDSQCMALDVLGIPYELVAWSEIDKYACQAHDAVYPQYAGRNVGDMTKVDWGGQPDFDLLTYSTPCQDISTAGKQAGLIEGSDTRSSIIWYTKYAIQQKRPKYLLGENVKNLVGSNHRPEYFRWLQFLESEGYTNYYTVINAKDQGIPQNRERVFTFSILGDHDIYHFPLPVPLELRLKDILEEEVGDEYVLSKTAIQGFLKHNENHKAKGTGFLWIPKDVETEGGQIANCLSARQFKSGATDNYIREFRGGESVANCLRGTGALCPTDNTIREIRYSELSSGEGIP